MSKTLIIRGDENVLRKHKEGADRLYGFMESYVSQKSHRVQVLSHDQVASAELASIEGIAYFMAHSRGTTAVLDQLRRNVPSSLEGIAFFDPSPHDAEFWNSLTMPRVTFISTIFGRPYAEGLNHSVHLQDNHYFTKSLSMPFSRIQEELDKAFNLQTKIS